MKLAELVVEMSTNTARLRKDFDQALGMANNFASAVKTALAGIGVGISIAGIAGAIKEVADYGAEIGRAAARTGMTTAQISGLKFAAETAGVSFETLQRSLSIFDRNVAGLSNTTSKAGVALATLGIQTKDAHGKILPAHELLLRISDAFSHMENSATKTADAVAIFGRGGAQIIPFLNEGRAGVEALEKQARDLGLVMGEDAAKACEQFEASVTTLNGAFKGLEVAVGMGLIPKFTDLIVEFVALIEEGTNVDKVLKDIAQGFEYMGQWAVSVGKNLITHSDEGSKALDAWANHAIIAGKETDDLTRKIEELRNAFKFFSEQGTMTPPEIAAPGKEAPELKLAIEPYTKSIEEFIKEMERAEVQPPTLERKIEMLNNAFSEGLIGLKEYNHLMGELAATMPTLQVPKLPDLPDWMRAPMPAAPQLSLGLQQAHVGMQTLEDDAGKLGSKMGSSFEKMLIYTRDFKKSLEGLFKTIEEFAMKMIFSELGNLLDLRGGAGAGGGFLQTLSGLFTGMGGKQMGGPVSEGQFYMVGESGPELFSPGVSGSIIPNSALSGGRGNINIDARGADAGVETKIYRALARMQGGMRGQNLAALYDYQRRGGQI
jgi:hypothetical protein